MTTLQEYIDDTANLVIAELPLQTLATAVALVLAYISNVGGWIPTVQQLPLGDGHPANGFTEQQAADAIRDQEINAVYNLEFTVTATIKVNVVAHLTPGLSLSAAAASMANQVSNFIISNVNPSRLPMTVTNTSTQVNDPSNSMTSGYTTQAIRQNIASEVSNAGTNKIVDFKAIALFYVDSTYGLDNTWNVFSVYTEADQSLVVQIKKYTNATYATLDGTSTKIYVISISPTTYEVVSGVIID